MSHPAPPNPVSVPGALPAAMPAAASAPAAAVDWPDAARRAAFEAWLAPLVP